MRERTAMRLLAMAMLLAAAPAPAPAPKVLGPDAHWYAYSSVPLAGMAPMAAEQVGRVLKTRRSYPEHSRVPAWHQRNGASRLLFFKPGRKPGTGKATDRNCEPAACEGSYTISGNMVIIDFTPRAGVMKISFFLSPEGMAMVFDDWGPKDGRVSPW